MQPKCVKGTVKVINPESLCRFVISLQSRKWQSHCSGGFRVQNSILSREAFSKIMHLFRSPFCSMLTALWRNGYWRRAVIFGRQTYLTRCMKQKSSRAGLVHLPPPPGSELSPPLAPDRSGYYETVDTCAFSLCNATFVEVVPFSHGFCCRC
jgi:hypothetical protein